jgi:hypothetical protein
MSEFLDHIFSELTNPIMTTPVNKTADRPPMSSMAVGGYRSANVTNPQGGYQKPFAITILILDHKYGHYVKPKRVTFKYPNFKKDVDPNAHVKVFNFVVKTNVKTSEKCVINAFISYMLRDTASS